jgi:hypothetical protein
VVLGQAQPVEAGRLGGAGVVHRPAQGGGVVGAGQLAGDQEQVDVWPGAGRHGGGHRAFHVDRPVSSHAVRVTG